jgi:hypothetical protein
MKEEALLKNNFLFLFYLFIYFVMVLVGWSFKSRERGQDAHWTFLEKSIRQTRGKCLIGLSPKTNTPLDVLEMRGRLLGQLSTEGKKNQ